MPAPLLTPPCGTFTPRYQFCVFASLLSCLMYRSVLIFYSLFFYLSFLSRKILQASMAWCEGWKKRRCKSKAAMHKEKLLWEHVKGAGDVTRQHCHRHYRGVWKRLWSCRGNRQFSGDVNSLGSSIFGYYPLNPCVTFTKKIVWASLAFSFHQGHTAVWVIPNILTNANLSKTGYCSLVFWQLCWFFLLGFS